MGWRRERPYPRVSYYREPVGATFSRRLGFESLEERRVLAIDFSLIEDINSDPVTRGSDPSDFVAVGDTLYFLASTDVAGRQLWKTDGTSAGTMLVEPNAGIEIAPNSLTNFNGQLYFVAQVEGAGDELWKSDGTALGTAMVKDINPNGSAFSSFAGFGPPIVVAGGLMYFAANDGAHGNELWKSDGTEVGTQLVKDIGAGTVSLFYFTLFSLGDEVVFIADDGVHGSELWKSDGTETGTTLVRDIRPGALSAFDSHPRYVYGAVVGDALYFSANDGVVGSALWRSDGTPEGTTLVKDVDPSLNTYSLSNFVAVGETLYFVANISGTGAELWKSDGTAQETSIVKDIVLGSGGSNPQWLTAVGDTLYFVATPAGAAMQLFKSDGSEAGTIPVPSNVGTSAGASPTYLQNVGDALFYRASSPLTGNEIWRTDGTAGGTRLVKDIRPGVGSSWQQTTQLTGAFGNSGGEAFFLANDGVHGNELWKSDGTEAGTVLVKDILGGTESASPSPLVEVEGWLYFAANDGSNGRELWRTNGTPGVAELVKNIRAGSANSDPTFLTEMGGMLYFVARDDQGYYGLWKSDGTEAGTELLINTFNGYHATSSARWPENLVAVGDSLYFSAWDSTHGYALWKTDGTPSGTVFVKDTSSNYGGPHSGRALAGTLVFVASDGSMNELWVSDGSAEGTVPLTAFEEQADIRDLVVVGNKLYFLANDASGWQLWETNGTSQGTGMLVDLHAIVGDVRVDSLVASGGILYFAADQEGDGLDLWKTDGTEAGTMKLAHIFKPNGTAWSASGPHSLVDVDGTLFFTAIDVQHGREIWKSDGTLEGTKVVRDIWPGPLSQEWLTALVNIDGSLYFQGSDGVHGYELWKSDGTEEGTVLVEDFTHDQSSGEPQNIHKAGNWLVVSAMTDEYGRELWSGLLKSPSGDFDRDGVVDGHDFLTWQRALGSPAVPAGSGADGDNDGMVGGGDLEIWRTGFNQLPDSTMAVAASTTSVESPLSSRQKALEELSLMGDFTSLFATEDAESSVLRRWRRRDRV